MQEAGFLSRLRLALSLAFLGQSGNVPFSSKGRNDIAFQPEEVSAPSTASQAGGREALQACEYQNVANPREKEF